MASSMVARASSIDAGNDLSAIRMTYHHFL
jgi:hypothetical protein